MAKCSAVWPNVLSAAITFRSVFQSSVFISLLKSWSIVVGPPPSKRTRTLSFFFTSSLLSALEPAGEEIIHDQGGDEGRDAKILLRIVVWNKEVELLTALDQASEEFVHAK